MYTGPSGQPSVTSPASKGSSQIFAAEAPAPLVAGCPFFCCAWTSVTAKHPTHAAIKSFFMLPVPKLRFREISMIVLPDQSRQQVTQVCVLRRERNLWPGFHYCE